MIYVGFIYFNEASDRMSELPTVLESYTQTPPTVINKKNLTLCYGKLSNVQDMDEVWENDSAVLMGRIFDKTHHCAFLKKDFKKDNYCGFFGFFKFTLEQIDNHLLINVGLVGLM